MRRRNPTDHAGADGTAISRHSFGYCVGFSLAGEFKCLNILSVDAQDPAFRSEEWLGNRASECDSVIRRSEGVYQT